MNLLPILKLILGMKFGWLLLIVGGITLLLSLVRNIATGSFSVAKFASGFNPFLGGVQDKLIYYGILALLAFGLYHQLTKSTTEFNTDYKNNIHNNRDVIVDQRVGTGKEDLAFVGIKLFGLKIGVGIEGNQSSKVVINNKKVQTPETKVAPKVGWFGKLLSKIRNK